MVYGLWLGGACTVAGEPGGGASTLSWADVPPVDRGSADEVGVGRGVCAGGGRLWAGDNAATGNSQMECGGAPVRTAHLSPQQLNKFIDCQTSEFNELPESTSIKFSRVLAPKA